MKAWVASARRADVRQNTMSDRDFLPDSPGRNFLRAAFSTDEFAARDELVALENFAQSGAAAIASTRAAAFPCGATLAVPVTRILTIHPNNLSDFLLSLPVLRALRESFPGTRICGAMRPALANLLHHSPFIDDFLPRAPGGLSQQTALMLQLRNAHFDLALALSPSRSTTILAWSSGAATRVGLANAKMEALLTHRVEKAPPFNTESYLEIARAVGCAARDSSLRNLLSVSPLAPLSAARLLEKYEIHGDFIVAAPANASSPRGDENAEVREYSQEHPENLARPESHEPRKGDAPYDAFADARRVGEKAWREAMESFASPEKPRALKEWPAAHWARALDVLAERAPIVLLGNAPSPVAPLMKKRALDLSGALDLPTMAALCGGARLFLGTDGGMMHLAAAQETPVVALFGPTDWRRRGPRAASTRVLHSTIECAPCQRRECLWNGKDERACMTRLAPDEVVEAARQVLGW